ncbi:MAG: flagellar FlbD family protein [Ignavibacteriales bacterium]
MIKVSRLNGDEMVINADLIESLEATPDTVVVLTNGKRLVVRDSVDEIVRRVIEYKRGIFCSMPGCPSSSPDDGPIGG